MPFASAVYAVCVRRPIGLRSPFNRFAFAIQSVCVRSTMIKCNKIIVGYKKTDDTIKSWRLESFTNVRIK